VLGFFTSSPLTPATTARQFLAFTGQQKGSMLTVLSRTCSTHVMLVPFNTAAIRGLQSVLTVKITVRSTRQSAESPTVSPDELIHTRCSSSILLLAQPDLTTPKLNPTKTRLFPSCSPFRFSRSYLMLASSFFRPRSGSLWTAFPLLIPTRTVITDATTFDLHVLRFLWPEISKPFAEHLRSYETFCGNCPLRLHLCRA